LVAAALLLAAVPMPAAAASHPETTRMERPGTPVERVRLRVLDKVEARRVEMTVPLGTVVPLPDALHSVRVTRYTGDFRLDRMPAATGPAPTASADGEAAAPTPRIEGETAEPVPREKGAGNPAALLQILREGETVAESWVFARAPYLFQPPNLRYTFALLGAGGSAESTPRP
jgi:hypothetical protein